VLVIPRHFMGSCNYTARRGEASALRRRGDRNGLRAAGDVAGSLAAWKEYRTEGCRGFVGVV